MRTYRPSENLDSSLKAEENPPENKEMSPGAVAKVVGRSVSRVSHVLAALRLAEVVRHEADGRRARYRLKHPRQVRQILRALPEFIDSALRSGRLLPNNLLPSSLRVFPSLASGFFFF